MGDLFFPSEQMEGSKLTDNLRETLAWFLIGTSLSILVISICIKKCASDLSRHLIELLKSVKVKRPVPITLLIFGSTHLNR